MHYTINEQMVFAEYKRRGTINSVPQTKISVEGTDIEVLLLSIV
jgi:hypothetical protein